MFACRLGNSTFDGFAISAINRSSVYPAASFDNNNGPGLFVEATSSGPCATFNNVSTGDAIRAIGNLDLNGNMEISGAIIPDAVKLDLTGQLETSSWIWTRDSLYADKDVWVGFISGINSWRIVRVGGELRFYVPNSTTNYWFFNDAGGSGKSF